MSIHKPVIALFLLLSVPIPAQYVRPVPAGMEAVGFMVGRWQVEGTALVEGKEKEISGIREIDCALEKFFFLH